MATQGSFVYVCLFSEMHHFAGSLSSCDALILPGLSLLLSVPAGKPPVSPYFFSITHAPDYAGGTSAFLAVDSK